MSQQRKQHFEKRIPLDLDGNCKLILAITEIGVMVYHTSFSKEREPIALYKGNQKVEIYAKRAEHFTEKIQKEHRLVLDFMLKKYHKMYS